MATADAAVQVKTRPIIFGADSVRAILAGVKTQTRRVVKWPDPAPYDLKCASDCKGVLYDKAFPGLMYGVTPGFFVPCLDGAQQRYRNPWGWPSTQTRFWVRERFKLTAFEGMRVRAEYADETEAWHVPTTLPVSISGKWHSPIHMPRWASRINLELIAVRVERLQDISEQDAKAEGAEPSLDPTGFKDFPNAPADIVDFLGTTNLQTVSLNRHNGYRKAWDSLNAKRGYPWDSNPYVWVIEFKPVAALSASEADRAATQEQP